MRSPISAPLRPCSVCRSSRRPSRDASAGRPAVPDDGHRTNSRRNSDCRRPTTRLRMARRGLLHARKIDHRSSELISRPSSARHHRAGHRADRTTSSCIRSMTEYAGFANATWHVDAALRSDARRPARAQQAGADLLTSIPTVLGSAVGTRPSFLGIRVHLLGRAALRAQQARIDLCACRERLSAGRAECCSFRMHRRVRRRLMGLIGSPIRRRESRRKRRTGGLVHRARRLSYRLEKHSAVRSVVNDMGINANGGKARVNGLEASGSLRPTPGLTLTANGAYTERQAQGRHARTHRRI